MDHTRRLARTESLRTVAALGLLGVGGIGLLLPVVPGTPFLIVGAWLLHRRVSAPLPLTSALSRAHLTPLERVQVGGLLFARRATMAAESLRLSRRARRRQRDY